MVHTRAATEGPVDAEQVDGVDAARKEHSKHVRKALAWLDTKPLASTLAARLIMEPNLNLLKGKIFVGSLRHEHEQMSIELDALESGAAESVRSYSVLDCALNRLEDDFDNQWKFLAIGASMWEDIVPLTSHTRAFRCTVFRMLSRSQCLVTVKLRNLHKKPPFAAFATLRSDEDAAA